MTITCPRCGLAFETRATTNTRCRRCKTVVRIGTGSLRESKEAIEPPDAASSDEPVGGDLVVVAFVVLALAIVVPPIVRAIRRRRADRAAVLAPDGAVAERGPFVVSNPVDATRADTGPDTTDEDPHCTDVPS